jgi:hypothetical protein
MLGHWEVNHMADNDLTTAEGLVAEARGHQVCLISMAVNFGTLTVTIVVVGRCSHGDDAKLAYAEESLQIRLPGSNESKLLSPVTGPVRISTQTSGQVVASLRDVIELWPERRLSESALCHWALTIGGGPAEENFCWVNVEPPTNIPRDLRFFVRDVIGPRVEALAAFMSGVA